MTEDVNVVAVAATERAMSSGFATLVSTEVGAINTCDVVRDVWPTVRKEEVAILPNDTVS